VDIRRAAVRAGQKQHAGFSGLFPDPTARASDPIPPRAWKGLVSAFDRGAQNKLTRRSQVGVALRLGGAGVCRSLTVELLVGRSPPGPFVLGIFFWGVWESPKRWLSRHGAVTRTSWYFGGAHWRVAIAINGVWITLGAVGPWVRGLLMAGVCLVGGSSDLWKAGCARS